MRQDPEFKPMMRGDLALWGVDKVDGAMVTIVGQIECTDSGRWPVQREFNRRMKIRFQQLDVDIAYPAQTRFSATTIPQGSDAPAQPTPPNDGADSGT
jgi:hypothetical protein